jgi:type I restriction enzyme S subunit
MAEPYLNHPTDWRTGTLDPSPDGEFIVGVKTGSTPRTSQPEFWGGDNPWLTPKEITGGTWPTYVTTTDRTLSESGLASSSARLLPPDTVMLSKRAPVGLVAINKVPMATNQGFLNFTCGPGLRPAYLAYWFVANRKYLDKIANGSTYPELYNADLFEFQISVPSVEDQDRIVSLLRALQFVYELGPAMSIIDVPESIATDHDMDRDRLNGLNASLLSALLSGTLRV